MKRLILIAFLIVCSMITGACSMFSPFKSINTCSNVKGNGAACANIESNLEYSIATDGKALPADEEKEKSKKKEKVQVDNSTLETPIIHTDKDVEKAELVRLITVMNINNSFSEEPVLIPPTSYKVVIMPYSNGKKFYSGRNIYIVAGKPRWVAGNFLMNGEKYKITDSVKESISGSKTIVEASEKVSANFFANIKQEKNTPPSIKENTTVIDLNTLDVEKKKNNVNVMQKTPVFKHRVSAYLLNCRDLPSIEGNSIAVFEKDAILDISDKSMSWWRVSYYDVECYVNSLYLYNEPEL